MSLCFSLRGLQHWSPNLPHLADQVLFHGGKFGVAWVLLLNKAEGVHVTVGEEVG